MRTPLKELVPELEQEKHRGSEHHATPEIKEACSKNKSFSTNYLLVNCTMEKPGDTILTKWSRSTPPTSSWDDAQRPTQCITDLVLLSKIYNLNLFMRKLLTTPIETFYKITGLYPFLKNDKVMKDKERLRNFSQMKKIIDT